VVAQSRNHQACGNAGPAYAFRKAITSGRHDGIHGEAHMDVRRRSEAQLLIIGSIGSGVFYGFASYAGDVLRRTEERISRRNLRKVDREVGRTIQLQRLLPSTRRRSNSGFGGQFGRSCGTEASFEMRMEIQSHLEIQVDGGLERSFDTVHPSGTQGSMDIVIETGSGDKITGAGTDHSGAKSAEARDDV
jgi:hypothetical protein